MLEANGMDVSGWIEPSGEWELQYRIEGFAKPLEKRYDYDLVPVLEELRSRRVTVFPSYSSPRICDR